jgi:hypothetical protein
VGLERSPLGLASTTEEILERNSSGSGLERGECGTHYPQTLVITSPTSCGRSVGIVRSQTKATEFSFFLVLKQSMTCTAPYYLVT